LLEGAVGMTEASAMRMPSMPCTRSWLSTTESAVSPIAQVPTRWGLREFVRTNSTSYKEAAGLDMGILFAPSLLAVVRLRLGVVECH
jgi:hypothetical protein